MLHIGLPDELRKRAKLSPLPSPDSELFYEDPFFCWDIRRTKMDTLIRIKQVSHNLAQKHAILQMLTEA